MVDFTDPAARFEKARGPPHGCTLTGADGRKNRDKEYPFFLNLLAAADKRLSFRKVMRRDVRKSPYWTFLSYRRDASKSCGI